MGGRKSWLTDGYNFSPMGVTIFEILAKVSEAAAIH
jgi:hypothetical protein